MDILNVNHKAEFEDSVVALQYYGFKPYNITALNENDEIRIAIQTENSYVLPSKSFISIKGEITTDANAEYPGKVVNNGFAHLFEEIKLNLNAETIDRVRNPGVTSLIKGICSYNKMDCIKLENAGWVHPSIDKLSLIEKKKFNVCIPLTHLMGFAEDFTKIIINSKLELVLLRAKNTTNITNGVVSKITLSDFEWLVPMVTVSDYEKLKLLKLLEHDKPLTIDFRSWQLYEHPTLPEATKISWNVTTSPQLQKPRIVIVGFQEDRNKIDKDGSHFDLCNVNDVTLFLNDKKYPHHSYGVDKENNIYGFFYEMYARFQESYYDRPSWPLLNRSDFVNHAPLFVFDCSKQHEDLKSGSVNVRIDISASKNVPANTKAYCLIIHDRSLEYTPLTNIVTSVI